MHIVNDIPATEKAPSISAPQAPIHSKLSDFRADSRLLLLATLAIPIGAVSAVVAKTLLWLIGLITNISYYHRISTIPVSPQGHHLGGWAVVVPVIGALLIGVMARYGSEKIRGHGIPEALEAILTGKSLINPRIAILKPLSSAISIGTGGPFGAEGPIIMTGGAFGSIFAQLFHLSATERKALLAAGATAGMTAVFATPIAAVLLAVELLLFEWRPRSLVPVGIAALVASIIRIPLLGNGPIFPVPPHAPLGWEKLAAAAAVGLLVGTGSGLLTMLVYKVEDCFQKLPVHWMWWPALGAIFVGIGGIVDPRVLGVGYDSILGLLQGEITGGGLVTLMIVKTVVWAIALGSGTSGGVLAPLLIIGGALGAMGGQFFPGGDSGLWAMIGMSAVMSGAMRAPLTGTFFALELTHDLNALPAMLLGCICALTVSVLLLRRSILTEKLARRGQHITYELVVDIFHLARVGDAMSGKVPVVPAEMSVLELSHCFVTNDSRLHGRHAVFITNASGRLAGIITRGDVAQSLRNDPAGLLPVIAAGNCCVETAHPDELIRDALDKMLRHNIGRLAVVDPRQSGKLIGYLGRAEILAAHIRYHEEENHREKGPFLRPACKV